MKVFEQTAVHYSLSIPSFVNKKNKCDLTKKKSLLGITVWPDTGADQLYLQHLFLVFLLRGPSSCGLSLQLPYSSFLSEEVGWGRRHDLMRVGNVILSWEHVNLQLHPHWVKSVSAMFDLNFVRSVCMSALSPCISKYVYYHVRTQDFLRCGLVTRHP